MEASEPKLQALERLVASWRRVLVAFSGGVDSTFLMAVAHDVLGDDAVAVIAVSPSLARRELDGARSLACERGWPLEIVSTHEMGRAEYVRNDSDRCYWCKDELFRVIGPIAEGSGAVLAIGTNRDDLTDHRPGLRAAAEWGVRSPLAEIGLTKAEIRSLSSARGLPTANKPASPCLSSRFAYGVRVTAPGLRRVEAAEAYVRGLGFKEVRVRDHGDRARVEVEPEAVPRALELADDIRARLTRLGYPEVAIDPAGFRSGSLNAVLPLPALRTASRDG